MTVKFWSEGVSNAGPPRRSAVVMGSPERRESVRVSSLVGVSGGQQSWENLEAWEVRAASGFPNTQADPSPSPF